VEGIDSRGPWKNKTPSGAPFRDHADLRQFYLQLGSDKSANMLRAGRLELDFGDGRLVGSLPWANTARTFDGARGMYAGSSYRLDAFATSVVKVEQDRFDRNIAGNNFYGVYGSFTKLVPKAAVEPFVFWRRQSGLTTEAGVPGTINFGTLGFRAAGKLPSNFDYDAQMALQSGSLGDERISAWAGHWLLGYSIASIGHTPRLFAEYNQASGDKNPTDNRKETFDQLYPTGHDKYGLTDLVGWENMRHVRGGLGLAFGKGWTATTRYSHYWLDDAHDALYNGGGIPLARSPTGIAGTNVGGEFDIIAAGKLRPTLGFSAGVGYFVPGTFLKNTTPGKPYTYPYAMLTYAF
ncbi:MAG TPA: alginate export family protein, partial [Gemmatimonadaceae bacterium]